MNGYEEVFNFWFNELEPEQWWTKDSELDRLIKKRFGEVHESATSGELYQWRLSPSGRLAEIIVLDQFSRNIFRDSPKSFYWDPMALVLSQEAIHQGAQKGLHGPQKAFLYMPFMHSESILIQKKSIELFSEPGLEENYDFAQRHYEIIEKFGRFPHRNTLLGRESAPEETEFLKLPNSSF